MSQSFYEKYSKKSGLYEIINNETGQVYVGSTVDLYERKISHFADLNKGSHHNNYLQNSFNKYGESTFHFRVIKVVAADFVLAEEQKLLDDLWDKQQQCYNILDKAYNSKGYRHTRKSKRKIAVAMQGNSNAKGRGGRKTAPTIQEVAKISKTLRKEEYPKVVDPQGIIHTIFPSLNQFCKLHKLGREGMRRMIRSNGKRKQYKGWRILDTSDLSLPCQ